MTWPTLRYPLHTIPQDYWDPSLQAWQMAWSGHILLADPGMLWHANTFYPESWSFAFSDTCSATPRPACSAPARRPRSSATT